MGHFIIINSVLNRHRTKSGHIKSDGYVEWIAYIFLFLFFIGFPIVTAILLLLGYFD